VCGQLFCGGGSFDALAGVVPANFICNRLLLHVHDTFQSHLCGALDRHELKSVSVSHERIIDECIFSFS
jgi:hypothetical protein